MDGQSGGICAANSSLASTMTETDPGLDAVTSPSGSTQAEAVRVEAPKPCGRFPIYPCKA